jgi:hypothetical protein
MASVDMCEHGWPGTGCKDCKAEAEQATQESLEITVDKHESPSRRLPFLNDPKYIVANNQIVNRATGVAIPDDEPVFIVRAKDMFAAELLVHYAKMVDNGKHQGAILGRVSDFLEFAREHPERMQRPTTALVDVGDYLRSVVLHNPRSLYTND